MVNHGVVSEHPLVLSFCDLSAWCYLCEAYVHNQVMLLPGYTVNLTEHLLGHINPSNSKQSYHAL